MISKMWEMKIYSKAAFVIRSELTPTCPYRSSAWDPVKVTESPMFNILCNSVCKDKFRAKVK